MTIILIGLVLCTMARKGKHKEVKNNIGKSKEKGRGKSKGKNTSAFRDEPTDRILILNQIDTRQMESNQSE